MRITKYGQCCLLIEWEGKRILTDPGRFGTGFEALTELDLIIITHEHADHLHIPVLTQVLSRNPGVPVVCNSAVGKLLAAEGISFTVLEGSSEAIIAGVPLCACDGTHEEIYEDFGQVQNTGYRLGNELYYPGDSFTPPGVPVRVLALPVAGPWCAFPEAIRFAQSVGPAVAFPVHDWLLTEDGVVLTYRLAHQALAAHGIVFAELPNGKTIDLHAQQE